MALEDFEELKRVTLELEVKPRLDHFAALTELKKNAITDEVIQRTTRNIERLEIELKDFSQDVANLLREFNIK